MVLQSSCTPNLLIILYIRHAAWLRLGAGVGEKKSDMNHCLKFALSHYGVGYPSTLDLKCTKHQKESCRSISFVKKPMLIRASGIVLVDLHTWIVSHRWTVDSEPLEPLAHRSPSISEGQWKRFDFET